MIPVLGIPTLNRADLLKRCLDSIDYPVGQIVVVNNGKDADVRSVLDNWLYRSPSHLEIRYPVNAGVATSWNTIIKLFPAPYWLLVNDDIQFAPGDLEKMHKAATQDQDGCACLYGNHGASFWLVTKHGVERVGLFDENLYPAYLEDCDWSRRADLLNCIRRNVPGIQSIHGTATESADQTKGSCTINSSPGIGAMNARTHRGNFDYYLTKWGGENGQEKYTIPFGAYPDAVQRSWEFIPNIRAKQQW